MEKKKENNGHSNFKPLLHDFCSAVAPLFFFAVAFSFFWFLTCHFLIKAVIPALWREELTAIKHEGNDKKKGDQQKDALS